MKLSKVVIKEKAAYRFKKHKNCLGGEMLKNPHRAFCILQLLKLQEVSKNHPTVCVERTEINKFIRYTYSITNYIL